MASSEFRYVDPEYPDVTVVLNPSEIVASSRESAVSFEGAGAFDLTNAEMTKLERRARQGRGSYNEPREARGL